LSDLEIKVYGEDILRDESAPIENIDGEMVDFLNGMTGAMMRAKGLGLAANQVGRAVRAFSIDMSHFDVLEKPMTIINPEIVDLGNNIVSGEEGCLSFPGLFQVIERPDQVTIKSIDIDGREYFFEASGMVARVIQHEIDHLDGVLFIDKLSPAQRRLIKGKLNRIKAGERVG
jgi:peptide deformylase